MSNVFDRFEDAGPCDVEPYSCPFQEEEDRLAQEAWEAAYRPNYAGEPDEIREHRANEAAFWARRRFQ